MFIEDEENDENDEIRVGKDEMNLIEHPWAAFGKRTDREPVIEHEWETRHPLTGKALKASWKVAANPALGLPTAADLRVYLVLMELTRDLNWPQVVPFTRHDLIKRLGWSHNQKHYEMLFSAFERLRGTTMSARNTFWDAGAGAYRNATFGILDSAEIVAEKGGRKPKTSNKTAAPTGSADVDTQGTSNDINSSRANKASESEIIPAMRSMSGHAIGSYFKWNDIIYKSFQDGYLRTFDLEFALSLDSDVALALYRYLGKKAFQGRGTFSIELQLLFDRHLGLAPAAYPSLMKQRLAPAHAELVERHFLEKVEYGPMRSRPGEKVIYTFARKRKMLGRGENKKATEAVASEELTPSPTLPFEADAADNRAAVPKPDNSRNSPHSTAPPLIESSVSGLISSVPNSLVPTEASTLIDRMTAIGVSSRVATELATSVSTESLVLQLDCLEDREPRAAAATFVKAVREGWEPPAKYLQRLKDQERARQAKLDKDASAARKAAQDAKHRQEMAIQEQDAATLDAVWEKLDERTQQRLELQVREKLEENEFLRARLQAGKLTSESPDWVQTRHGVLREMLGRAKV